MCCSRIRVTLNGVAKEKQGIKAGTYLKASGLINNRSHWLQIDGDQALWYSIIDNRWNIGFSSDLGSNIGGITSVQDSACPTKADKFLYATGDEWTLGETGDEYDMFFEDSVSISAVNQHLCS